MHPPRSNDNVHNELRGTAYATCHYLYHGHLLAPLARHSISVHPRVVKVEMCNCPQATWVTMVTAAEFGNISEGACMHAQCCYSGSTGSLSVISLITVTPVVGCIRRLVTRGGRKGKASRTHTNLWEASAMLIGQTTGLWCAYQH